jgi:hypothetical protein
MEEPGRAQAWRWLLVCGRLYFINISSMLFMEITSSKSFQLRPNGTSVLFDNSSVRFALAGSPRVYTMSSTESRPFTILSTLPTDSRQQQSCSDSFVVP